MRAGYEQAVFSMTSHSSTPTTTSTTRSMLPTGQSTVDMQGTSSTAF